jgi:predicted N-acyltransferase
MPELRLEVAHSISDVSRDAWNALLSPESTPFVDHRFLAAMEASGCAGPRAGWEPTHFLVWRGPKLVAAAPAYAKEDSDGDFARDWDLGSAATRAGLAYYPKLVFGVPFTPCTGQRLLTAPASPSRAEPERADSLRRALIEGAKQWCRENRVGTLQVLFPLEREANALESLGLARRVSFQFHWRNEGYRDYADFLSRFTAKRRAMLRRERAAASKQGIAIRTVREREIRADPDRFAALAHRLHSSTVEKLMWGRGWLNADFYRRVFREMPEHLELVLAERAGKVVAGAFNVRGAGKLGRLYGRYWGCFEDHPFLHFNVCYYHSIEACIAEGIPVFEGGAGGEHKLSRGFLPAETTSGHLFFDARVDEALRDHLRRETPEREAALARWRDEASGYRVASPVPPNRISV